MGESSPKSLRGGGHGGRDLRRHRDPAAARLRRSLDPRRARRRARSSRAARARSPGGSSAAPAPPIASTARTSRQKDVSLLFADAATGAHSPALVSQGKIGAVIAAKPVERRQMLEEAAGISGLHARRKDAEQKLRAAEANLTRLGEILGEQEQRAGQLRRQARAADRYRKLSDEIRCVEARLLHARWVEAESSAERRAARGDRRRARRSSGSPRAIAEAQDAHEAANAGAGRAPRRARRASRGRPHACQPAGDRAGAPRHRGPPACGARTDRSRARG